MPFIGVRIRRLTLAMNSLFAQLAVGCTLALGQFGVEPGERKARRLSSGDTGDQQ